jgi:hypothetical protein
MLFRFARVRRLDASRACDDWTLRVRATIGRFARVRRLERWLRYLFLLVTIINNCDYATPVTILVLQWPQITMATMAIRERSDVSVKRYSLLYML